MQIKNIHNTSRIHTV